MTGTGDIWDFIFLGLSRDESLMVCEKLDLTLICNQQRLLVPSPRCLIVIFLAAVYACRA